MVWRAQREAAMTAPTRARLLDLYPINALRSVWPDKPGDKEQLIAKIVKDTSLGEIQKFAFDNFPLTKQHIYLLHIAPPVGPRTKLTLFPDEAPVIQGEHGDSFFLNRPKV